MLRWFLTGSLIVGAAPIAWAHAPPLLPAAEVAALANELSGETAKRNLEGLARFHRQRGSAGFHQAVELIAERTRAYGLSDVEVAAWWPATEQAVAVGRLMRSVLTIERHSPAGPFEDYERRVSASIRSFGSSPAEGARSRAGAVMYRRRSEPRGPLMVFGHDYFMEHAKAEGVGAPKLLDYQGEWGDGEEYAYEALKGIGIVD